MITEQELKDRCTPEFIKWMCEYAEGFSAKYKVVRTLKTKFQEQETKLRIDTKWDIYDGEIFVDSRFFPLLIHRAVEGWNKKHNNQECIVIHEFSLFQDRIPILFKDYQSENLTQSECAMLHCLLDMFAEVEK